MELITCWGRRGLVFLLASVLASVLMACGGGGGGGGDADPSSSMSLSTQQLNVAATTDDAAPSASLDLLLAYPPVGGVYVGYTLSGGVVTSVDISGSSASRGTVSLQMASPVQLGVGVHSGSVQLFVCYDSQCARQLTGSPQTLSVRYTVSAGRAQPGPAPQIATLSPATVAAGGAAFTLVVNGSGFVPLSVLQWNGQSRSTFYDSPTQLTVSIPAADVAVAGTAALTVSNANAGGGSSAAVSAGRAGRADATGDCAVVVQAVKAAAASSMAGQRVRGVFIARC